MSNIAIIGGHGKVALHLARILTDGSHTVGSFIRNPQQRADITAVGSTPVIADVENLTTEQIAQVLVGYDAVVWSAGAGGGSAERTYAVDRDAAIRSMDAAQLAGVTRYVMVSYKGSRVDHGASQDDGMFAYYEAKAAADDYCAGRTCRGRFLARAPSRKRSRPVGSMSVRASRVATFPGRMSHGSSRPFSPSRPPSAGSSSSTTGRPPSKKPSTRPPDSMVVT